MEEQYYQSGGDSPITYTKHNACTNNEPIYNVNEKERTIRLIAFIFIVFNAISVSWLIIPLLWMIPMAFIAWGIYKGTRRNTTAFAICTLIFASLVSGILLLISEKDN